MSFRTGDAHGHIQKGLLITTAAGLLYTLDLPLLRLSLADMWTMVSARGFFIFVSLMAIWLIERYLSRERLPFFCGVPSLNVIISVILSSTCYIGAVVTTNAANVVFISALIPLITATMSNVFIGERVRAGTWLAMLVALGGVLVIVWDGIAAGTWLGDFLAFMAAFYTAATFTAIRGSGQNLTPALALGSLGSSISAMVLFGATPAALMVSGSYGLPAWAWLAINGLVAIPIATALFAKGPRYLPSTDVSMFFLLETVLTPIWIWMLFGEVPALPVILGGSVVIGTLILHSLWRLNQAQQDSLDSFGLVPQPRTYSGE